MTRRSTHGVKPPRPKGKREDNRGLHAARPGAKPSPKPPISPSRGSVVGFDIIERTGQGNEPDTSRHRKSERSAGTPFRVLIAVHRPRFRGRSERAAALTGWEVTALLNKQDPVGMCARPPRPPDLLILSGDFGRQKDLAIFRAVQRYRQQGMFLVGLVDDCRTAPEGFPDSVPAELCDVCLQPPYKAAELRRVFAEVYEALRGKPAPPPIAKAGIPAEETEEEDDVD